ncbi:MAG: response regulator [Myxococcales bacterium]|nr:MAG: response regulator [Myxococcales bacterium]
MVVQRSLAQQFLALQAALTSALAVWLAVEQDPHTWAAVGAALVYVVCWRAFKGGWEPARQVAVGMLTLLLVVSTREPHLTERPALAVMMPSVVALMLTSERWIVASAVVGWLGLVVRSGFRSPLLHPLELSVLGMAVTGLVLARRAMDAAVRRLAGQAESAERARQQAEAAAREAIAERDRAGKLEAQVLHMQRLEGVGRLAGGIAHDFNNLLTVISASVSMAERAAEQGESPAVDLQEAQHAVGRASELTQQLLAFARRQVLRKRSVELSELVSGVERMLRRVMGASVELATDLCREPLPVHADAGQLEQVIVNLVLNARDAVQRGGRIVITTRREASADHAALELQAASGMEYACVEVRDDGAGMSAEVKERLFEPFFTTKAPGKGTGLGLATSFGIVRQHEGMIEVESEVGVGSTMRVLLPLASAVESVPATSGVQIAGRRPRVLVVEDEPQIRAIAARALTNAGFEVVQAANGALGLASFKSEQPAIDVMVTDVIMPELTGLDLARAVRQLDPRVGLVFMSGYPEAMHGMRAGEFQGAAFLNKPFSPQLLVAAVRERLPNVSRLQEQA